MEFEQVASRAVQKAALKAEKEGAKTLDIEEAKKKPAKDNASSGGDTDRDEKWTEIIGGMTIYKDAELKTYLEQAGFHDVQIHKKKSWLCITAWK